ncbi:hypothetical protein L914_00256 [Phytophthora nicotianae]|uniref:Uncharacterized protein n=1 Tax=Phytophthora nicotianae TaxID=4792 RepID=W2P7Q7_PHYNI|nr:hypothetical protein L914_00256 [Phytophthora nicotianae]
MHAQSPRLMLESCPEALKAELEEIKPLKVEPIFVDVYGDTEEKDPKDYKFR